MDIEKHQLSANIEFRDLTYVVPHGRNETKLILRGLGGEFRSGQLTAIMGTSGSGKSTLLNAISGYKTVGATGCITMNGCPVNFKEFRKRSRYILQDNLLQPFLTVHESMTIAADLKLSRKLSQEKKSNIIAESLATLRLTNAKDTLSDNLSGGEKRRLSIALELINDPMVIFLDEPTTGLDDVASFQCVSLLKTLANEGRTVICSIHTPSARIFELFDNVYVLADGLCVYRGLGANVLPFLSNIGQPCPKHYNPADFVIEVSSGEFGDHVQTMSKAIANGNNGSFCLNDVKKNHRVTSSKTKSVPPNCEIFAQFKTLLYRRSLQTYRNKENLLLRSVVYFVIALCLGSLFLGIGQDASKTIYNCGYCFVTVCSFLYMQIVPVCLHLPVEVKHLQREYFNMWYGFVPYYLAMAVETLPLSLVLTTLSVGVSYTMSGQPMDLYTFSMVVLICLIVAVVSDSFGLMIGSTFSITNGMFIAPVIFAALILLAMYGIGSFCNVPMVIKLAYHLTYPRYAFEGVMLAIYNSDRPPLACPEEEVICLARDPKFILRAMGVYSTQIWTNVVGLMVWLVIFRLIGYYLLRLRLKTNRTYVLQKFLKNALDR